MVKKTKQITVVKLVRIGNAFGFFIIYYFLYGPSIFLRIRAAKTTVLERRSGVLAEIAVHAIVLAYRRGDKESDFSALNSIRYYRFTRTYVRIEIVRY